MNRHEFGVSFSAKYAREMGIDPRACLKAALQDLGMRQLRLMSYWDIHEAEQGQYDFKELDWQMALAKKHHATVSLAIGLRQPRWPESHWPEWAKSLSSDEWQQALCDYIQAVVERYRDHPSLGSWQLENEALLKTFGENGDFSRGRLEREMNLVRELDSKHPIIMTTSDSWGIPWRKPVPDIYAFSIYRYFYDQGAYRHSRRWPKFYRLRAALILILRKRHVFIHELQAEPWGPRGTSELNLEEQAKSMTPARIKEAIDFARATQLLPAYLWGLEWWYWLKTEKGDPKAWETVRRACGLR